MNNGYTLNNKTSAHFARRLATLLYVGGIVVSADAIESGVAHILAEEEDEARSLQEWRIHARYPDNGQHFVETVAGEDALDSAIRCQVSRIAQDDGAPINVAYVMDPKAGVIVPEFGEVGDGTWDMWKASVALKGCLAVAKSLLSQDDPSKLVLLEAESMLLLEVISDSCDSELDEINVYSEKLVGPKTIRLTGYGKWIELDPVDAIRRVYSYILNIVQKEGWACMSTQERAQVYQVRAMAAFLPDQLRAVLSYETNVELQEDPEIAATSAHEFSWATVALS